MWSGSGPGLLLGLGLGLVLLHSEHALSAAPGAGSALICARLTGWPDAILCSHSAATCSARARRECRDPSWSCGSPLISSVSRLTSLSTFRVPSVTLGTIPVQRLHVRIPASVAYAVYYFCTPFWQRPGIPPAERIAFSVCSLFERLQTFFRLRWL